MSKLLYAVPLLAALPLLAQSPRLPGRNADRRAAEYYIDAYSAHYAVPPALVRAIVTQESDWNLKAVSNKGAMGIMQLMPATAAEYKVTSPFDLTQNIGAGVHFLGDLIRTFHGDLRLVVAAYNCGTKYVSERGL